MTKPHAFDPELAAQIGLHEAIMVRSVQLWVTYNVVRKRNHRDGRTWTYNSYKGIAQQFPYLSENQIRRAMETLVESGILTKRNFNQVKGDCRNWYAFTDEAGYLSNIPALDMAADVAEYHSAELPEGVSLLPNGQANLPEGMPDHLANLPALSSAFFQVCTQEEGTPLPPANASQHAEPDQTNLATKAGRLAADAADQKRQVLEATRSVKPVPSQTQNAGSGPQGTARPSLPPRLEMPGPNAVAGDAHRIAVSFVRQHHALCTPLLGTMPDGNAQIDFASVLLSYTGRGLEITVALLEGVFSEAQAYCRREGGIMTMQRVKYSLDQVLKARAAASMLATPTPPPTPAQNAGALKPALQAASPPEAKLPRLPEEDARRALLMEAFREKGEAAKRGHVHWVKAEAAWEPRLQAAAEAVEQAQRARAAALANGGDYARN